MLEREITIVQVPVGQLKAAEYNPRRMDAETLKGIDESISRFGIVDPIIANSARKRRDIVIGGHARLTVAKNRKMKTVPVVYVDIPELERERELNLRLNKNLGDWDMDLLKGFSEDMLTNVGFSPKELDAIFATDAEDKREDRDEIPELPEKAKSKLGDIYALGEHRLICGDSTDPQVIKHLLASGEREDVDMICTDPPYNVNYIGKTKKGLRIKNDAMASESFRDFLSKFFAVALSVTRKGGAIYVCHADLEGENFRGAMRESGWLFKQCLIWSKDAFVMGRFDYHWKHEPILYGWAPGASHRWQGDRKQTTVLQFDRPKRSIEHPTMKPVDLVQYMIVNSSERGDVVLDMFAGGGQYDYCLRRKRTQMLRRRNRPAVYRRHAQQMGDLHGATR